MSPPFRVSANPALAVFLALGCGILLGDNPWWAPAYSVLVLVAAVAFLCLARVSAKSGVISLSVLWSNFAAILAVMSFGAQRSHDYYRVPPTDWSHRSPAAHIVGRVSTWPHRTTSGVYVDVEALAAVDGDKATYASGRIRLTLRQGEGDSAGTSLWQRGDHILIASWPEATRARRNPFDFDYKSYLRHRRIRGSITLSDARAVSVISQGSDWLDANIAVTRSYVTRTLGSAGGRARARAILAALLLGDQSSLDSQTRARFRDTGLAHVLAVSGLHVLLVGMAAYHLLHSLLLRVGLAGRRLELTRMLLTTAILAAYVLLAGGRPSMVRAVFMAFVLMALAVMQRSAHVLNGLGVAGTLMLITNPGQIHDVGFQLSFSAVAAIVLLTPGITKAFPEAFQRSAVLRAAVNSVSVSMAATIGTLPFTLIHFGGAALGGLLLNVVAVPLTTLTLGATVIGTACTAISTTAGALALQSGTFFSSVLLALVDAGHGVLGRLELSPAAIPALAVGAAVLAFLRVSAFARRSGLVLLACTLLVWPAVRQNEMDVVFLDVGHGDAILIRLPTREALLIDTGGSSASSSAAKRTVLPHLRRWGVRQLDWVVISHAHNDHMGGLGDVLRNVHVSGIVHNGLTYDSASYTRSMMLADSLSIPLHVADPGQAIRVGPAVLHFFAPASDQCSDHDAPHLQNECSVVMRLSYGQTSLLLMGDAEAATEDELVQNFGPYLSSDVIKVAHHGSATSSTPFFVRAASRRGQSFAVFTAGPNNRFRLPDSSVVQRWEDDGAAVLSTADGAVWLASNGVRFREVRWRDSRLRIQK